MGAGRGWCLLEEMPGTAPGWPFRTRVGAGGFQACLPHVIATHASVPGPQRRASVVHKALGEGCDHPEGLGL